MAATSQQTYLECLLDYERYSETIWVPATYSNAPPDAAYWGDGKSSGNGGIRGNCGTAIAIAVLVQEYPAAANRPARLAKVRQALNYAANSHVSSTNVCVDKLQWGHGWQSALWAGSMGLACRLVESELPATTVAAVKRAIADEATYRAGIPPASGYVNDTKAEENGWNGNVVALAAAWLTNHQNASLWLTSTKQYLANTYTVPDTTGDPLASWVTTQTLYPDYSLENHGFYHPTYQMVSGMSMGDSLLMARLCSPQVASELRPFAEHNVLNVWTNLSRFLLDSGEFAYPSGLDWELHDYEHNSYIAWLATHFDDPLARWTDTQLAQLTRYRQIVNGDGRFVGASGGGFFREAVEARRTAIACLHWKNPDYPTGAVVAPGAAFQHLSTVQIISQRSSSGFVSISYGPQIMALIEPAVPPGGAPTNVFVTTPRLPGIIGLGALDNPTTARLVTLTTNAKGFEAHLELTNGANGGTQVYVNAAGEAVGIVEVPWPTVSVAGSAPSFIIGVENDPLTGGSRTLQWASGSAMITNRSGAVRSITNDWACIDGWYGIAAGPAGYFKYQAAASYNRSGAVQDTFAFRPDEPLGPRYAVWFPGKNANETALNAGQISWSTSDGTAILTFPAANGTTAHIAVPLPPMGSTYPAYALSVSSVTASSSQSSYPATNAVDGNLANFWVSYYGPTNHGEWLKVAFSRQVALSSFQVYPRTENGGYGPKDIQLFLDVTNAIPSSGIPTSGSLVYTGAVPATSVLDFRLPVPVRASNAVLVVLTAFDRGVTTNPRNVQIDELIFYERAVPGTFADWAITSFSEAQLADPNTADLLADPDKDGAPNLLEFAGATDATKYDASALSLRLAAAETGQFSFTFRERTDLGDVSRTFESSTNLLDWQTVGAQSLNTLTNAGGVSILQAVFPIQPASTWYRVHYRFQ